MIDSWYEMNWMKTVIIETNWSPIVTVEFMQTNQARIDEADVRRRARTSWTAGARRRRRRKTTRCGPLWSKLQTAMKRMEAASFGPSRSRRWNESRRISNRPNLMLSERSSESCEERLDDLDPETSTVDMWNVKWGEHCHHYIVTLLI